MAPISNIRFQVNPQKCYALKHKKPTELIKQSKYFDKTWNELCQIEREAYEQFGGVGVGRYMKDCGYTAEFNKWIKDFKNWQNSFKIDIQ